MCTEPPYQPGEELKAVQWIVQRSFLKDPPILCSAFMSPLSRGRVYIEVLSDHLIREFFRSPTPSYIYIGTLTGGIPSDECCDVLDLSSLPSEADHITALASSDTRWVRITSKKRALLPYLGDLGRIVERNLASKSARVYFVPRFFLRGHSTQGSCPKRQLLLNPDLGRFEKPFRRAGNYWLNPRNGFYLHDGLYFTEIPFHDLDPISSPPPSAVTLFFSAVNEEESHLPFEITAQDLLSYAATLSQASIQPGDLVEITSGSLARSRGVVQSTTAEDDLAVAVEDDRMGAVLVSRSFLKRIFRTGMLVRVVSGLHSEKNAMVVSVEENLVTCIDMPTFETVRFSLNVCVNPVSDCRISL